MLSLLLSVVPPASSPNSCSGSAAMHKKIVEYLKPILGEATALNMVKHYCARMKLSPEDVNPSNLPQLANAMRPMLAVWLGSAGAARVADEIARMGKEAR
jgi:hypothetical protein